MKNYSKTVVQTVQTQPIFGRTDMVQNNAGGYVFQITPQERLERFLLIGSEGGSYYVGEQKLTAENADRIVNMIKTDGVNVIATIIKFARERRAPKVDPGIFVLALCCAHGSQEVKQIAYAAIHEVCNTATHLFLFLANIQQLRGWSRGLRTGVAKWYTTKTPDSLAYQVVKYRDRAGFTHKDAIKLAHPSTENADLNHLLAYIIDKGKDPTTPKREIKNPKYIARERALVLHSNNPLIHAYETAKTTTDDKELANLITNSGLTWEMVPTERLNNATILTALLEKMPITALIRNLNRFAWNNMTKGQTDTTTKIVDRLTDEAIIKKDNLHPLNIVNALITYGGGKGQKSDKTWTVNRNITDALEKAFEISMKHVVPLNKKILLSVDISGSMSSGTMNSDMTAAQIANVLAYIVLRNEKHAELIWFDDRLHEPKLSRKDSLRTVMKNTPNGGGTDCSLPIKHAITNKLSYDAILIFTDNETWAGQHHSLQLLAEYRKINPNVKVIEIALTANDFSTLPTDDDKNVLRITGFDNTIIPIINKFLE